MLRWNPQWRAVFENDLLVVTAGADEIFALEDVAPATALEIERLAGAALVERARLSRAANDIVEQLLTAGIIAIEPAVPLQSIGFRFVGDADDALDERLRSVVGDRGIAVVAQDQAALLVYIRTNGRLADILGDDYIDITVPHLLLDLAYHHTLSVGPLVFPGETTCLGCLVGRLSTHWGDGLPPAAPRMTGEIDLIAGIAALEIERAAGGDYGLVNRTFSFDFGQRQIKEHTLYKLPWCPICGSDAAEDPAGRIELPWEARQCSGS